SDGSGRGLDLAFDRLLCRGLGAPHEHDRDKELIRCPALWIGATGELQMHKRHLLFWVLTLVAFVFLLWLLSEILLPFVAGLALAYLQVPLADRMERRGMNRTVASLLIVGAVVLVFILLGVFLVPIMAEQGAALLSTLPSYVERLQALLAN